MFGFVLADTGALTDAQRSRYSSVYCGICRQIRAQSGQAARLGLSYDMAFLALLGMSLYEPEEITGEKACALHPIKPRKWVDNEFIRYSADMNVALCYYKALDNIRDKDGFGAKQMASVLQKPMTDVKSRWPEKCARIAGCLEKLTALEEAGEKNPDLPAGAFGELMGELFVFREDMWAPVLRQLGDAMGRFIYLADAALDYRADKKKGRYNPFLAMETGEDWARWEEYLVLEMGRCAQSFEMLPLVQDKDILNNIIYSGIWIAYRRQQKKEGSL